MQGIVVRHVGWNPAVQPGAGEHVLPRPLARGRRVLAVESFGKGDCAQPSPQVNLMLVSDPGKVRLKWFH